MVNSKIIEINNTLLKKEVYNLLDKGYKIHIHSDTSNIYLIKNKTYRLINVDANIDELLNKAWQCLFTHATLVNPKRIITW